MAKKKTTTKKKSEPTELMVVNDTPGEECRIAILQDGHLEELYAERVSNATNVGNIYKGRVVNVEPAIQAAFIDYGQGQNGFLHISDLHPRYFPGDKEKKERVGKKIPRRERPPIQDALKRGQEVLVQVLKEGIGTKGPTLTSYLSIPGRLLVAMPDMGRVGVSRKVEDEQKRREMRQILDSLDLPEGLGFILRTAGFEETKTELKRDVAYLMRLWKVMERRIESVGAPCELYTESDLLIRTIRDVLRPSIKAIVVDSESAYDRATGFLQVVAPRSAPKVVRYGRHTPIFHSFDVERQIDLIHSREVPLKSGGKLVIDQTEALVAIDVNSGRSRSARDSETNAYNTNIEACDEICRQLRLRDLGGLLIHDLIDMHQARHRKAIEDRFRDNLKRDRAKTTTLRISRFGILEMTRQRMRPSMRKSHFMECPNCQGRGEIMSPESVGADAVRHIGYLLQYERVARVELACSPRVASVLLSARRRTLVDLEDDFGKKVEVRVSEAIPIDRVDFYAYDDRNADIDIDRLPVLKTPKLSELEREPAETAASEDGPSSKRRRRRRRKPGPADATAIALAGDFEEELLDLGGDEEISGDGEETTGRKKRRRRRRRRRGDEAPAEPVVIPEPMRLHVLAKELGVTSKDVLARCRQDDGFEVKNHMSNLTGEQVLMVRGWFAPEPEPQPEAPTDEGGATSTADGEAPAGRRRRRRGRRGRRGGGGGTAAEEAKRETTDEAPAEGKDEAPAKKKRSRRSKKTTDETEPVAEDAPKQERSTTKKVAAGTSTDDEPKSSNTKKTTKKKTTKKSKTKKKTTTAEPAADEAKPEVVVTPDGIAAVPIKSPLRRNRRPSRRVRVSGAERADA